MDITQLRIATPQSFAPKPEQVQLPSQKGTEECVLLQRPDIITLINGEGDMPDVLTNLMLSSLNNKKPEELTINQETLPQIYDSINYICKACFVQPKLWDNDVPDEEHMPIAWLSFEDKTFVFAWALGAQYVQAASFRPQPGAAMDVVQSMPGVQGNAKRGNRHSG